MSRSCLSVGHLPVPRLFFSTLTPAVYKTDKQQRAQPGLEPAYIFKSAVCVN